MHLNCVQLPASTYYIIYNVGSLGINIYIYIYQISALNNFNHFTEAVTCDDGGCFTVAPLLFSDGDGAIDCFLHRCSAWIVSSISDAFSSIRDILGCLIHHMDGFAEKFASQPRTSQLLANQITSFPVC